MGWGIFPVPSGRKLSTRRSFFPLSGKPRRGCPRDVRRSPMIKFCRPDGVWVTFIWCPAGAAHPASESSPGKHRSFSVESVAFALKPKPRLRDGIRCLPHLLIATCGCLRSMPAIRRSIDLQVCIYEMLLEQTWADDTQGGVNNSSSQKAFFCLCWP